jgi:hypothetical protein
LLHHNIEFAVVLSACRSTTPVSTFDRGAIEGARVAEVPLPATTPFDATPNARAAYLESYRDGYRSGLVSFNVLFSAHFHSVFTASEAERRALNFGWHEPKANSR